MWPKAFAQLVELAPHISRLLPVADRFFQNKTSTDDATVRALDSRAEQIRTDLRGFAAAQAAAQTASHASLTRQFERLQEGVTTCGEEARAAQTAATSAHHAVTGVQANLEGLAARLGSVEVRLERASDRARTGPVVLLLVLTNLVLLACTILLLVHRR